MRPFPILRTFQQAVLSCVMYTSVLLSPHALAFTDSDSDGMPDEWEVHFGLNEFDASDAATDLDADGFANDLEFMRGGNPLVANSGRLPDYQVYWDGILNEWRDQSPNAEWATHNTLEGDALADVLADLQASTVVHSGLHSLAMEPTRWRFLNLLHNNMDMSFYDNLEFYIHGGELGNQNLQVSLLGSTFAEQPVMAEVSVNDYIEGGNVAAGEWRKVSIPLSDLLPKKSKQIISRINITGSDTAQQTLYYLDDIKFTAPTETPRLVLDVYTDTPLSTFSEDLLGSNGAYWVTNMNNDTLVDRTVNAGISTMRYPGGNVSDTFFWQEWNHEGVADWITTPDDYIDYLARSGTKGIFTANFGTGSAAEAVSFLEYVMQSDADIPVWEIGNEIYGTWQTTWTHNGKQYMNGNATHDGAKDYCAQLKAVDPKVKVAMVGPKTKKEYDNFAKKAINNADDCFDYYSFHFYAKQPGQVDYHGLLNSPVSDIPQVTKNIKKLLAKNPLTADVQLAMTEYNSYSSNPEVLAKQTVNMLFLADMLGQAASNDVALANHWFVGGVPSGNSGEFYGALVDYLDYHRQPSYYVFPLWTKMGSQLVKTKHRFDTAIELSSYASIDEVTGNLTLMVINKTGDSKRLKLDLNGFSHGATAYAFEAKGDALNSGDVSYNGVANPTDWLALIDPVAFDAPTGNVAYGFAPYSVTLLRFEATAE